MSKQIALELEHLILLPEEDVISSLYDIVERFQRGLILTPNHQREFVWSQGKRSGFIERLRSDRKLVGSICTYQLTDGRPSAVFLNDGYQRTRAALEYWGAPNAYGDTQTTAESYLRRATLPIQHRHYRSHDDALVDFQLLNMGTHLTMYEFYQGVLAYMENWESVKPYIDNLHEAMWQQAARIVTRKGLKPTRINKHKYLRSDLGLLYRFGSRDKAASRYDIGRRMADVSELSNKRAIEYKVRDLLETLTPTEIEKMLAGFQRFVEDTTAMLVTIWHDSLNRPQGEGLNQSTYRHLLEAAIWRRHNRVSVGLYEEYVYRLLENGNGKAQVFLFDEDGTKKYHQSIALGRLQYLQKICEILETDFYNSAQITRQKRGSLKSGFDNSHVLPFSEFGEGDTFPEPSSRNRARGANMVE